MVKKMPMKAIVAAINSPKTPPALKRGLIKKYWRVQGEVQQQTVQPVARPVEHRGQMSPTSAAQYTAGLIFRRRRVR